MNPSSPDKKQLRVFVFGLVLILLLFSWRALKTHHAWTSSILFGLSCLLVIFYALKKDFVIELYKKWMVVAAFIGSVITFLLMFVIFYCVFTPVGLLMRLLKKDPLHIKSTAQATTYWIDRKPRQQPLEKSAYERQF